MKDFLENYGFAILASIIVILLIAMATPVGNLVKTQVSSIVESFAYRVNNKIDVVFVSEESPIAVVMLDSPNSPVNGTENVTFRSSAPLSTFQEVRVDDEVVDPSNYDLTEGSTIVEFHADYILTLSKGEHNVEIVSNGGTAISTMERDSWNGLINNLYYVDDELFTGETEGNTYRNGLKIEFIKFYFPYNDREFQAEKGMTWAEWVASDYNTGNFVVIQDTIALDNTAYPRVVLNSIVVLSSNEIIANANYIIQNVQSL